MSIHPEIQLSTELTNEQKPIIPIRSVLYLRTKSDNMPDNLISELEKDTNSKYEICPTLPSFLTRLTVSTDYPSLILTDSDALLKNNVTSAELVTTISTLVTCAYRDYKPSFGVIVDKTCGSATLKDLQKSDIDGIIPKILCFGYDTTKIAVNALLNREYYWPKSLMDMLSGEKVQSSLSKGINLTPRQTQVLGLVCNRGLSNKKIANILKISESTVKIHISDILKIYGVRNRTQLVLAASNSLKA